MNNNLRNALITIAVLIVIFVINNISQRKYESSELLIFDVKPNSLAKITISETSGNITLLKNDSLWTIEDNDSMFVKTQQINTFMDNVLKGKYDLEVAKNNKKWNKYGVSDSLGKKIQLFNKTNEIISTVTFGRNPKDYAHSYFRIDTLSTIYRTSENLYYQLNTKSNFWGELIKPDTSSSIIE